MLRTYARGMAFPYGTHSWHCTDPSASCVIWHKAQGLVAGQVPPEGSGWRRRRAGSETLEDAGKEVGPLKNQPGLQTEGRMLPSRSRIRGRVNVPIGLLPLCQLPLPHRHLADKQVTPRHEW